MSKHALAEQNENGILQVLPCRKDEYELVDVE